MTVPSVSVDHNPTTPSSQLFIPRGVIAVAVGSGLNAFSGLVCTAMVHWSDYLKTRIQSAPERPYEVLRTELKDGISSFFKSAYQRGLAENMQRAFLKELWRGGFVIGIPALTARITSQEFREKYSTEYNIGNGAAIAGIDSILVCPAEVARTYAVNSALPSKGLYNTLKILPFSHWFCGMTPLLARQGSVFIGSAVLDPIIKEKIAKTDDPAQRAIEYLGYNALASAAITVATMLPDHLKSMAQALAGTPEANKESTLQLFRRMCKGVTDEIMTKDKLYIEGKGLTEKIVTQANEAAKHASENVAGELAGIIDTAEKLKKVQDKAYRAPNATVVARHFERQMLAAVFRYPAVFAGIIALSAVRSATDKTMQLYEESPWADKISGPKNTVKIPAR